MSLPDDHLQQALQHAPDRELAPSDTTRKAVLDYAANALHRPAATWLQRCWLALTSEHWHVARWQLAGMGSAITVLLVVVVFWGDRNVEFSPSEFNSKPIQVASVPTDNRQRKSDVQVAAKLAERAPQSAKAEKYQDIGKSVPAVNASGSVIVATNEPNYILTDKVVVASTPEAVVDEVVVAKKIAPPSQNRYETKAKAKSEVPSAAGAVENNMVRNVAIERGVALASTDIQAGILRILTQGKPADTSAPLVDAVTGYRIKIVEGSDVGISLPDEIEAYNQTMRDWHAKSGN